MMKKLLTVVLLCAVLLVPMGTLTNAEDGLELELDESILLPDRQEDNTGALDVDIEDMDPSIENDIDNISLNVVQENILDLEDIQLEDTNENTLVNNTGGIISSGVCGDNLTWILDEEGVLTISGTGKMWDFNHNRYSSEYKESPWDNNIQYIKSVKFSEGITYIGTEAFDHCEELSQVEFADTITEIGEYAFAGCPSLSGDIVLPENLKIIRNGVFSGSGIESITIPGSVWFLDNFQFCTNLKRVLFKAYTSGPYIHCMNLFYACFALESIQVEEGHSIFFSHEGVLYDKQMGLVQYPLGKKDEFYEVKDGCMKIYQGAFGSLSSSPVRTISLPRSLKVIEKEAFKMCENLKSVEYEGSEEEWKMVNIDTEGNSALLNASFTYKNLPYKPTSIKLSETGVISISMHETLALTAEVTPVEAETTLSWSSNDTTVVQVDTNGKVIPINSGKAIITVTTDNGLSASVEIEVTKHNPVTDPAVPATCIQTGKTEGSHCSVCGTIIVPQQETPLADHTPVTDPAVPATYTETGLTEGSHCSVCGVILIEQQVIPRLGPAKVVLNKKKATLYAGLTLKLKATVKPGEAESSFTWITSNKKVADVTQEGEVKALKKGTAVITVTTENGKQATCMITVPVAPSKVTLNQKKVTLKVGNKLTLKAMLTPEKAKTKLTWTTSNKKVATVSDKGMVKAIKPGTVKITVKTANGKKANITVTVTKILHHRHKT